MQMGGIEAVWVNLLTPLAGGEKTILDIGCRDLRSTLPIAKLFGTHYYGVDVDANAVVAGSVVAVGLGSHLSEVDERDFGRCWGKKFDIVIASCMIYHLRDELAEEFFRALAVTLKKRGRAFVNINDSVRGPHTWEGRFPFVLRSLDFYRERAEGEGLRVEDRGLLTSHGYNLKRATGSNRLLEIHWLP